MTLNIHLLCFDDGKNSKIDDIHSYLCAQTGISLHAYLPVEFVSFSNNLSQDKPLISSRGHAGVGEVCVSRQDRLISVISSGVVEGVVITVIMFSGDGSRRPPGVLPALCGS